MDASANVLGNEIDNLSCQGGTMKKLICFTVSVLLVLILGLPLRSTAQESGYNFIRGPFGPQVCIGRWVPPTSNDVSGTCVGQVLDVVQFNAVSSRLSADRLDQATGLLESIDARLAAGNDKLDRLIDAAITLGEVPVAGQDSELSTTIAGRFDAIPAELLANDLFKQELAKLKKDILNEVAKRYQPLPAPSVK
jgi:hypothetical protein